MVVFFLFISINGSNQSQVDRLDGASNFLSWKARVSLILKEHDLWEIVERVVLVLTDATKNKSGHYAS
jgi:hypothetical protein